MSQQTYEMFREKVKEAKTENDVENLIRELYASTKPPEAVLPHSFQGAPIAKGSGKPKKSVPEDDKYSLEEEVVSLYAKGLTTGDIVNHLRETRGIELSSSKVSEITDKALPEMHEWMHRPLSHFYPFIYLDGIRFNVTDSGKRINKCVYTVLGLNEDGYKEIIGLWIANTEQATFWLQVLNEIKSRGVNDVLVFCVDGLTGFSEAIEEVFPNSTVQLCIVHQVRRTMKAVSHKDRKEFCADLRAVYTATNEEAGRVELQKMMAKKRWEDYDQVLQAWVDKWSELSPFFQYGPAVRRIMYTTNMIESVHGQFRKVTNTTKLFPHDEALRKLLWLAQRDIASRWLIPTSDWPSIMRQLAITFKDRIDL